MAISAKKKAQWKELTADEKDRVVRMAWEDRTAFDDIKKQFGFTANEVVRFMRTQLDASAFKRWRRRANEQGHLKHEQTRGEVGERFKCKRQRIDGSTKGWK